MSNVAAFPLYTREEDTARRDLMGIVRDRSFRQGKFILSSGLESDLYFNMKPTMMNARGAELTARCFMRIMADIQFDYIGGLEMGAVPTIGSVAALSSAAGKPINSVFVRKERKAHGTRDQVEGLSPDEKLDGKHVLIVDDVATSGKSFLKAIEAVRLEGGIVSKALCIVDREEGASEFLSGHDVSLLSVFKGSEFRITDS